MAQEFQRFLVSTEFFSFFSVLIVFRQAMVLFVLGDLQIVSSSLSGLSLGCFSLRLFLFVEFLMSASVCSVVQLTSSRVLSGSFSDCCLPLGPSAPKINYHLPNQYTAASNK